MEKTVESVLNDHHSFNKPLTKKDIKKAIAEVKQQNQKRLMKRKQVYKLIDSERDYQDALPNHSTKLDETHPVASWILFMEQHLNNAKREIYALDPIAALEEVRKVAALGVACMENNDTPERHVELN